ncbi:FAD-dependent oxidoreductase [Sphingomonas sp.]|jgi:glycine/D-amino acid oxidase-like deaminating enzyme|uniref:FAD-dependent oxidoreductase n=1 Tax=Sphingomonas sp. TaxID=28214 RepID=UPI00260EDA92|nr:FAD-dependent oxidoreductase [Sphingomonas sp.]MDF2493471.1 FAD-dependent oxidoreductase [Sphingomonas sp.]
MLDRRAVLAAAPLILPACTTTRARPIASPASACLAPVRVAADRVIRTVAGLRPYRAGGFVVRADPFGDKRVVHNYGHGGAGITLSWGTSRLAVDAGLPGHSGSVAVIGAGIMGLTTARLCQEAGFPVTLYTKALPPDTTSNIAGGQWEPASHFAEDMVTPEWRAQYAQALEYSWRRFQIMVGEDYGIRWVPTYQQTRTPPGQARASARYMPGLRYLDTAEHPFPISGHVIRFDTMYAETGRLLRKLEQDVRIAGGRIVVRNFDSAADVDALPERLVFNCTGLGAAALFGDRDLIPVRGQLAILLPQPEVNYAFGGQMGYMFPRPDGIVCGGTFERGERVAVPQPGDIDTILSRHAAFFGGFRCSA